MKDEDVIFQSAVDIMGSDTPMHTIDHCFNLIRFEHLTCQYFFDVAMVHPLMKSSELQTEIMKEICLYQWKRVDGKSVPTKAARYWGEKPREMRWAYFNGDNELCLYGEDTNFIPVDIPEWVERWTSFSTSDARLLLVDADNFCRSMALIDVNNTKGFIDLPGMETDVQYAGVLLNDQHVYIFGGTLGGGRLYSTTLKCM